MMWISKCILRQIKVQSIFCQEKLIFPFIHCRWYSHFDRMSNVSISSTSSIDIISPIVKFWLYLVFLIPSIICTLFVLYYLVFDRTLRRSINNHVIIVLLFTALFCEVTMYPWMLYYFYHVNNWQRSFVFCMIWGFIDWGRLHVTIITVCLGLQLKDIFLFFMTNGYQLEENGSLFIIFRWFLFVFIGLSSYTFVYFYPSCRNMFDSSQMICNYRLFI